MNDFCKSDKNHPVYIITNPTYKGARKQTPKQKEDVQFVFKEYERISNLDYSSCWLYLSSKYIQAENAKASIVTTGGVLAALKSRFQNEVFVEGKLTTNSHAEFGDSAADTVEFNSTLVGSIGSAGFAGVVSMLILIGLFNTRK